MQTTKITFKKVNSNDIEVYYEKDFVIIRKLSKDIETNEEGYSDEIYLDNSEIKKINKTLSKNLKELCKQK